MGDHPLRRLFLQTLPKLISRHTSFSFVLQIRMCSWQAAGMSTRRPHERDTVLTPFPMAMAAIFSTFGAALFNLRKAQVKPVSLYREIAGRQLMP